MQLSKEEKRELIWYFWKKGKTGSQILKELAETLGEGCPSKHMVYKWIDRFESGWDDFDDAPHGSRPKSSKTETNIELIQRILDEDRRITVRQLEDKVGISKSSIHSILTEDLEMSKLLLVGFQNFYQTIKSVRG